MQQAKIDPSAMYYSELGVINDAERSLRTGSNGKIRICSGFPAPFIKDTSDGRQINPKAVMRAVRAFVPRGSVNDRADANFAGADHLYVDPGIGQSLEHFIPDPRVTAEADPHDGQFGNGVIRGESGFFHSSSRGFKAVTQASRCWRGTVNERVACP